MISLEKPPFPTRYVLVRSISSHYTTVDVIHNLNHEWANCGPWAACGQL